MARWFKWVTDLETMQARATIEHSTYRGRLEHNVKRVVLHNIVARACLAGFDDRVQPLNMKGLYIDIECKQATSYLLEASRHVYGHQDTVRRTGTRLKRRHWVTYVSSFVVRRTKVVVPLCCIVKGSQSNGYRADSPRSCKRGYVVNQPVS
ncbi:hypothetical protein TNCV_2170851 [Trichonephila clavipes]|nr:hypothetical protein TNCV_2170851 [Trichonephila clavipes]